MNVDTNQHKPVLLEQVLAHWLTDPNGCYVDGTYGRGGHSRALLQDLSSEAQLLVIDKDQAAMVDAQQTFKDDHRVLSHHGSFADMQPWLESCQVWGHVQGILLDLGVSSPQLDEAERGFSFQNNGPLDMRMNQAASLTAAQWVNETLPEDMIQVLKTLGEERLARAIVQRICEQREEKPFETTRQLADVCVKVYGNRPMHHHPATRTFQAIRMQINRELPDIKQGLEQAIHALAVGGRLCVITFHSLEDRLVKHFMQQQCKGDHWPAGIPILASQIQTPFKWILKKGRASAEELQYNRRARSATFRVIEKLL